MSTAKKGKIIVVVLGVINCLWELYTVLSKVMAAQSGAAVDIVRTLLTVGLYICIYKGFSWARILHAVLLSCLAAASGFLIYGFVTVLRMSPEVMPYLLWYSFLFLFSTIGAVLLFTSKSVKALKYEKQEKQKKILWEKRNISRFSDEKISEKLMDELLHAAMSGSGTLDEKDWKLYVVTQEGILKALQHITGYSYLQAKQAIVVCGDVSERVSEKETNDWIRKCSAVTENLILGADDMGISAVWCGFHCRSHAEKPVSELLKLSEQTVPFSIVWLGYSEKAACAEAQDSYDEKKVYYI